ncbi:hypothetical protein ABT001_07165 [Streptomyces sp. NPDC002793]|uniref:hypothetical protein n=1 Tax=Streptomyces sp. NPDC002793 TaxID=3154432 RepID=UPI003319CB08
MSIETLSEIGVRRTRRHGHAEGTTERSTVKLYKHLSKHRSAFRAYVGDRVPP